jgi:ribose transport system substrate-binding protein
MRFKKAHAWRMVAVALGAVMSVAFVLSASAASTSPTPVKVSSLPANVQPNYAESQTFARLFSSAYGAYKVPKAPWKFCESTNYLANGWEISNQAELTALVAQYKQAGLAKGGLTTVNSNLSVPLQITQLNALMSQGCNVIFAIPGSQTAFCPTFAKALAKNILVVTDDTPIFCNNVMNSSFPEFSSAQIQGTGLGKAMGGKGNVVVLTGIPGAVGEAVTVSGFLAGLSAYSGINVEGQVTGAWTESVAQTAMVSFIATHPPSVDGILEGAGMATGGELALQQLGRPVAKQNMYDPECSTFALWKDNPGMIVTAQDQGPQLAAYETFLVAARMLAGQQPVVNTLLYPIPGPTQKTFNQWYKPSMTVKSTCFATPPKSAITPNSYYNSLFTGGHAPKVSLKLVATQ